MPPAATSPVRWDEAGTPHSTEFDDIYRNESAQGGGLAQARAVFLQGCGLLPGPTAPSAWAGAHSWTVLENGFGLALNALATWHAWREDPQRPQRLHHVAIESSPVSAQDIVRSAQSWPELRPLAEALCAQWWGMRPGVHRLVFEQGRFCLTLLVGRVEDWATPNGLLGQSFVADSIYLDGFDPDVNPQMWSGPTMRALCAHARAGTRVATWCVAAPVRQALSDCGLEVQRLPGLAPKRNRLEAQYPNANAQAGAAAQGFTRPHPPERVWVLGAGLAGASLAREWADRGVAVTVLDERAAPAQGASGLPAGLFTPHGARQRPELQALTLAGMRHMHQLGERFLRPGLDWSPCGVLEQLVPDRRGKVAPLPDASSDDSCQVHQGLPGHTHPALQHPHAGWIRPEALVKALLDHPLIEFRPHTKVARIVHHGQWQALGPNGELLAQAPVACLAAGPGSADLLATAVTNPNMNPHTSPQTSTSTSQNPALKLKLNAVRGQVSMMRMADLPAGGLPQHCVNGHGSWIPDVPLDDQSWGVFGSGFDHERLNDEVHERDHLDNLARLVQLFPQAGIETLGNLPWKGWSGVRCTSPDRLPWCGPGPAPGLLVLTALGARGLTLGAWLAHALVGQHLGEPNV
ncbi:MAG: hypothetical protein RL307_531, partial [Pseudomonadota bacterium]